MYVPCLRGDTLVQGHIGDKLGDTLVTSIQVASRALVKLLRDTLVTSRHIVWIRGNYYELL